MALFKLPRNFSGLNQQTCLYLSTNPSSTNSRDESCQCRRLGTFSSSSSLISKGISTNRNIRSEKSSQNTSSPGGNSNNTAIENKSESSFEMFKSKVNFQTFGNVPGKVVEMNKYLNDALSRGVLHSRNTLNKLNNRNNNRNNNSNNNKKQKDEEVTDSDVYSLEKTITKMNQSVLSYYDSTYVDETLSPVKPSQILESVATAQLPDKQSEAYQEEVLPEPVETVPLDMLDDDMANSPTRTTKTFFSRAEPKESVVEDEATIVKQKAKERRAEKISRLSLESRTRALVQGLRSAYSLMSRLSRLEELSAHLIAHPECVYEATDERVLSILLSLANSPDKNVRALSNECMSLLGHAKPLTAPGIRILSVDGGGTRGIVAIEFLKALEAQTGKRVYELFDYAVGVSTGALLLAMICLYKLPLDDCAELYKKFSVKTFTRNKVLGTTKLVWNHGFYDSSVWENILRKEMGTTPLIEFSRDPDIPKFSAVSAKVTTAGMRNYLFRTYNLPPGVTSQYLGHCKYKIWEVIRASSAAPGYFKPFVLGKDIHEDGGILTNNPTALAIHESRLLWQKEKFHCIVSLGTGRFENKVQMPKLSLKRKISTIVDSACDTEAVHFTLQDLLPAKNYFRFNPYLSEEFFLDEIRMDKLEQMQKDARLYMRRNNQKLTAVSEQLLLKRNKSQKVKDWMKDVVSRI